MPSLLSRFRLGGSGSSGVRDQLERERVAQRRVTLVPVGTTASRDTRLTATIESVDETSVVVSKPRSRSGRVRRLGHLESFQLTIHSVDGELTGATRSLGGAKLKTKDGEVRGYRLALPNELRPQTPRRTLRETPEDSIFEGELHMISRKGPIRGIVEEITPRGARLRCRNGVEDLARGESGILKLVLPAPVGAVDEVVHLTEVDHCGDVVRVRLLFERPHAGILGAMTKSKYWPRRTVLRRT